MTARPSRGGRTAPTITDVARAAGVSPMTVSRVINHETSVRPVTRDAVNAAIADLRYQPNPAARSLAGAGPSRIGLLYANPSAAYLSELLVGGLDQASRLDVQLVVEKCEPGDHALEVAARMAGRGVGGVILPAPLGNDARVLDAFARLGVPAVAVGVGGAPPGVLSVDMDDEEAAREMTRHLLALGHRRIGFVLGSPHQRVSGRRLDGYRAALAEAGAPADEALVAPGAFTYRSGLDAAERLLDLAEPPTAVFASNDDMAAAAVAVAHRRGLDVPGDLTVCGFDDTTLATAIWPELTTVRQPIADMSRAAVEMLASAIRGRPADAAARRRVLDYALVRRQSDGPPRL